MKKIAVSQRVVSNKEYPERRDALDQRWASFFDRIELQLLPMPNCLADLTAWLHGMAVDGLLLTGGNDLISAPTPCDPAPERDAAEREALAFCRKKKIPVLGVCRGCQLLAVEAGAELKEIRGHVGTRHVLDREVSWLPKNVNSFHSLQIDVQQDTADMQVLARSADGSIEAFMRAELRQLGIMWHPERETEFNSADIYLANRWFQGVL